MVNRRRRGASSPLFNVDFEQNKVNIKSHHIIDAQRVMTPANYRAVIYALYAVYSHDHYAYSFEEACKRKIIWG